MKFSIKNLMGFLSAFILIFALAFSTTSCDSNPSKKIKKENVESSKQRINTWPIMTTP